jgi:hypothetical protein
MKEKAYRTISQGLTGFLGFPHGEEHQEWNDCYGGC